MRIFRSHFNGYTLGNVKKDLVSGLIVGIIAIPLGMAFAIASGAKPENGLYTTIIAGIIVSLLGGSRFQIAGPTGAFVPLLFAIVMQYGFQNLLVAGFLAGIFLLLMGIFRFGTLIKYIPRPVVIGFTSGIAVLIFSGQISNFLGLDNIKKHEYFHQNIAEIIRNISHVNVYSIIVAMISLVLIIVTPRFFPRVPGALVGLFGATIVTFLFFSGKVATIGSVYGGIPQSLPTFSLIDLSWERISLMLQPALIIAALGAIESLLSCVVADGMSGTRHNSNRELMAQGVANIVVPFFGGIPATGALARTATNIKSGAASPLSGVFHGMVVLIIILGLAQLASHIPLAGMAPILMLVAWNMSERREFFHILQTTKSDASVLIATFLLTVLINLTIAVQVGFVLAFVLFVKRMSELLRVAKVLPDHQVQESKLSAEIVKAGRDCPQIDLFTVEGPLFFGVAQLFEMSILDSIQHRPKVLILKMNHVPMIDATGESNLYSLIEHVKKHDGKIIIAGIQKQPLEVLKKSQVYEEIGEENFFAELKDAITYATSRDQIDHNKCATCAHFAFHECRALSQVRQHSTEKTTEAYRPSLS